jgi:cellulose synthase/poly-beta-1,6-N-acetylglucosamine synthase-like glycosyltransferase
MKLFIAVLTLSSQVDVACSAALLSNIRDLEKRGHKVNLYFETASAYVALARSTAVAHFLDSDSEVMMFLDSDLWFPPTAIAQLLQYDKSFVAGVYPYRDGRKGFPVTWTGRLEGNLLDCDVVPAGFSIIKRHVFEELKQMHPEWETSAKTDGGSPIFTIYDQGLLNGDKHYWTEDFLFCIRMRDIGVKSLVDPDITFQHCGRQPTTGSLKADLIDKGIVHA